MIRVLRFLGAVVTAGVFCVLGTLVGVILLVVLLGGLNDWLWPTKIPNSLAEGGGVIMAVMIGRFAGRGSYTLWLDGEVRLKRGWWVLLWSVLWLIVLVYVNAALPPFKLGW